VGQSQTQQQGRPLATSTYYGNTSPFAMMRRMMDDMDRLFSDFGFVQPGLLASSLFGPDAWSNPESSRALGSGQSGMGQQRSLSAQSERQQGVQRSNQQSMPSWSQGLWSPEVEVRERGNNIVIRADLPGLSRDDIDLEVDDDTLIIRGERRNDWEDEQEGYYRSERSYGTFYRAIPLPEGVDPNACNASFKDGVLEVTLPRPQETQPKGKKIQVK
jgi:HSP20 family protein